MWVTVSMSSFYLVVASISPLNLKTPSRENFREMSSISGRSTHGWFFNSWHDPKMGVVVAIPMVFNMGK